tara:strand:+ start:6233 stop:6679 length:447 start_codon:yes stop_codon:yes gene_type:complete
MSNKTQKLIELIKELIRNEILEMSSTATAGGEYSTPKAFKKDNKEKDDEELNLSDGMSVIKSMVKSEIKENYWHYRNDESMTTKQKLAASMTNIREALTMIERSVKYNVKLKNEMKFESDNYMKRTKNALNKISEKLIRLSTRVKDLV